MKATPPDVHFDARPVVVFDRVASESEARTGTWMMWPGNSETPWLATSSCNECCASIAAAVAEFEPVTVCANANRMQEARRMLDPAVRVAEVRYSLRWSRRAGPAYFVNANGEVRIFNWRLNAWGLLQCAVDAAWEFEEVDPVSAGAIDQDAGSGLLPLEGASLRTDGAGTFFIGEDFLEASQRRQTLSQHDIESRLAACLGARQILWLPAGLETSAYGGQLDNLVAPVRPGVVALAWTDDLADPRSAVVRVAHQRLSAARDARGQRLQIVKLQLPERSGASYVNHYACNRGVLVPRYGDPGDSVALEVIRGLYPGREVVASTVPEQDARARLMQRITTPA